ncbi:MAG TPA: hypothetical protein VFQ61_08490, partial [Polyangiaceae bacterium]|nr:hypothetical protein [Polyangiaceae bacterium]
VDRFPPPGWRNGDYGHGFGPDVFRGAKLACPAPVVVQGTPAPLPSAEKARSELSDSSFLYQEQSDAVSLSSVRRLVPSVHAIPGCGCM